MITLIKEAVENGARKRKACELLALSIRTVERWEKPDGVNDKRHCAARPTQSNALTEEEKEEILEVVNSKQYCDLAPCKIVPALADEGRYIASASSFYRLLRAVKQLTHRRQSKAAKHHKPKAYTATGPNEVWSWDISYLPTTLLGSYYYLYLVTDIYSRKIVCWSIHERESAELASQLVQQACLDEKIDEQQLVLHSDNGKPMKGATMMAMLEQLGVVPSFSRPSVSDDNPYSESLFRTIKYHPTFPIKERFNTIEDARIWMESFTAWYNKKHLHSGLKFITPEQRHTGEDKLIMKNRDEVYSAAKEKHPERWGRRQTRNWNLPESVTLNPDRKTKIENETKQAEELMAA